VSDSRAELDRLVRSERTTPRPAPIAALAERCVDRRPPLPAAPRVIVAAAGRGSRFGAEPKVLAEGAAGRPLLLRVLDAVAGLDPAPVVVVAPDTRARVEQAVAADGTYRPVFVTQPRPTGMGDAVRIGLSTVDDAGAALVVWGDTGALSRRLVLLAGAVHAALKPPLTVPTKRRARPYAAVERAPDGTVARFRLQREGDAVPAYGESDCGAFWIDVPAVLPVLAERRAAPDEHNGEFDFLPVVEDLAARGTPALAALVAEDWESQGVNTPADLEVADRRYERIRRAERAGALPWGRP
jgi:bifunctional N-acetylglucosamine-1-phosphate-uridyltransferase/glucosamine-1-phosphate-acetyltransferase GlmU-like protein